MPRFEKAPDEVNALAREIIVEFSSHRDLEDGLVKIDFLYAHPELNEDQEEIGPALSDRGVPCLAKTKLMSLENRADGCGDVRILIDAKAYRAMTREEKKALLDHELTHIIVRKKDGEVLLDDLDRPRLKLRHHDYEFGWFNVCALRHGVNSVERQQARRLFDEAGQMYWPDLVGEPLQQA